MGVWGGKGGVQELWDSRQTIYLNKNDKTPIYNEVYAKSVKVFESKYFAL